MDKQGPLSANVTMDDQADIVTAYGIKISGELFRTLGVPTPEGQWFRVIKVEDGVATIEKRTGELVERTAQSAGIYVRPPSPWPDAPADASTPPESNS